MPWIDYERLSGSRRAALWVIVVVVALALGALLIVALVTFGVGPEDVPAA